MLLGNVVFAFLWRCLSVPSKCLLLPVRELTTKFQCLSFHVDVNWEEGFKDHKQRYNLFIHLASQAFIVSTVVYQVFVQHGLGALCPWGITLYFSLRSSWIVGYPTKRRSSYTQWRQGLHLYILIAHCESLKCLLKNEWNFWNYLFLTQPVKLILFCLGWLSLWYRDNVQSFQ